MQFDFTDVELYIAKQSGLWFAGPFLYSIVVAAEGQGLSNLYGLLPFSQAQYMPAFIERDNIIIKS